MQKADLGKKFSLLPYPFVVMPIIREAKIGILAFVSKGILGKKRSYIRLQCIIRNNGLKQFLNDTNHEIEFAIVTPSVSVAEDIYTRSLLDCEVPQARVMATDITKIGK